MSGEELRALADAANDGREWQEIGDEFGDEGQVLSATVVALDRLGHDEDVTGGYLDPAIAQFIAAANPTAVLALLDERDALRAQVERVRALAEEWEMTLHDFGLQPTHRDYTLDLRDALDPQ